MTAHDEIRDWVSSHIEGEGEIALPDLAKEAIVFFGGDGNFLARLGAEMLKATVYRIVQGVVGETRIRKRTKEIMSHPNWTRWMERVGNRHIRVMAMTRPQLREAATERRANAAPELKAALMWDRLADRLQSDHVPVAAHWSIREMNQIWEEICESSD